MLNSNISSTCSHNMVNVGPLTAEIGWRVLGTPANFNGFLFLASLLCRCCSTEVNHTLHVWPSPGLVHYTSFWGLLSPNEILPDAKFTLRQSLALSYIGSVTARHSSSGRQPNFAAIPFDMSSVKLLLPLVIIRNHRYHRHHCIYMPIHLHLPCIYCTISVYPVGCVSARVTVACKVSKPGHL